MKYFLIIISLFLFGCNGSRVNHNNDSLITDTNQVLNPVLKTYPDTIQNKIIGNIKFGIDKKSFDQLSKVYQKTHIKRKRLHLGNYEYVLINSEFYQNKLYQLDLYNPFVHTESDLKQQIQGSYDIVTEQYGKPDSTHNGVIHKGGDEDLFVWHIGRKRIKITSGYFYKMYNTNIRFEDVSIIKEIQHANRKRSDSLTHSAKKEI